MQRDSSDQLEVVRGAVRDTVATEGLIDALRKLEVTGTIYAGYPVIASADSAHTIEAMLVSPDYGLVAFTLTSIGENIDEVKELQDQVYYLINSNLGKHENLRKGRDLAVTPNVISFYAAKEGVPRNYKQYKFANEDTLKRTLEGCDGVQPEYFKALCAAIQRVTTIKPVKKRENVKSQTSRGAILKIIEKEIANLDQHQKKAAIESPEGPQRVRGLAGSGKTVVLALKAAYLHAQNPQWDIVVTYHTRSLNQQFKDLIERFTLEHSGDKPNWEKLQIRHAWGSVSEPGVYSDLAEAVGVSPINYATAKFKYGIGKAFEGICDELLMFLKSNTPPKLYDCVIIDEAQDLPIPFFQMVHAVTKKPKRIVWAYDELQNLNNTLMPPVEKLFGTTPKGKPRVTLRNTSDEAQQDIILPVCYRNTPWALTLAHALGFGIYKSGELVQLFDDLKLWEEIGYTVESGRLKFGSDVTLKRSPGSYPKYFEHLIEIKDCVISKQFETVSEQYDWVARQIQINITKDELDPDDILVIFPDAITARSEYNSLSEFLRTKNINSHLAGVSTERDIFSRSNSVTVSSIYRAKGNEAPMVYILNADVCAIGHEMIKLRNILFTAITRSRAWVRICGVGDNMSLLEKEIKQCEDQGYKLSFRIPTPPELAKLRLINRDKTEEEKGQISKVKRSIQDIKALIDAGVVNPDAIPELRELLGSMKKQTDEGEWEND